MAQDCEGAEFSHNVRQTSVSAGFPAGCMKIKDANVSTVIRYFQKEKVSHISYPLKLLVPEAGLEPASEEF